MSNQNEKTSGVNKNVVLALLVTIGVLILALLFVVYQAYFVDTKDKEYAVPAPTLAQDKEFVVKDVSTIVDTKQQVVGNNKDTVKQDALAKKESKDCLNLKETSPNRIYIPSLCVSAPIVSSNVVNNNLDIPSDLSQIGWSNISADLESDKGVSLLSGHVQYNNDKGVLYDLTNVYAGARIITTNAKNEKTIWVVSALKQYHKGVLPNELFDYKNADKKLALVTCGGKLIKIDDGSIRYQDNVVAWAVPLNK